MTNISFVFTLVHFRITSQRLKINGAINAKYPDDTTPFSENGIFTTYFSTYNEYYKGELCYSLGVITSFSYKNGRHSQNVIRNLSEIFGKIIRAT